MQACAVNLLLTSIKPRFIGLMAKWRRQGRRFSATKLAFLQVPPLVS